MGQIFDIVDGWKNYVIPNEKRDSLAKQRLKVCVECTDDNGKENLVKGSYEVFMPDETLKEYQGMKCKICKCPASTFSRSKDYKCPLGKW